MPLQITFVVKWCLIKVVNSIELNEEMKGVKKEHSLVLGPLCLKACDPISIAPCIPTSAVSECINKSSK